MNLADLQATISALAPPVNDDQCYSSYAEMLCPHGEPVFPHIGKDGIYLADWLAALGYRVRIAPCLKCKASLLARERRDGTAKGWKMATTPANRSRPPELFIVQEPVGLDATWAE